MTQISTQPLSLPHTAPSPVQMWLALSRAELLRFLRNPLQAMATLFFPLFFYGIFGLSATHTTIGGVNGGVYLFVNFATYGLMSAALFTFGVSVSIERASGWLRLLKVTPLGAAQHLAAKLTLALVISLSSLLLLLAFAVVVGGVPFTASLAFALIWRMLVGSVPFVALGFALGFALNASSVAAVVNVVWLALSFGSGLFVPISSLPHFMQQLAPYLPSYHLSQLGWATAGVATSGNVAVHSPWIHWAWLAGYTLLFTALGLLAYRRDSVRQSA